jgi:hypothetical protein
VDTALQCRGPSLIPQRCWRCDSAAPSHLGERWRYGLLGALAVIALATALPVAYFVSTSKSGSTNIAMFVVRYVISCTTVFAVTLSAASLWIARRRCDA